MTRILQYIIPFILLSGCQESSFQIEEGSKLVVVEGWLTDIDTIQQVRVSLTQHFLDNSSQLFVNDADVRVYGSNGENMRFLYGGSGWYSSMSNFSGKDGVSYHIEITLSDNSIITSTKEKMLTAPMLDTISYSYYEQSTDNQGVIKQIYYPITQFEDAEGIENFYRFRVFKNELLFGKAEDIMLIRDQFFDGNSPIIENEFTSFEFAINDSISLELQEITASGYNYLRNLRAQTTSLESASTSITPGPINGNLQYNNSTEKVLGFWGTSSIQKIGIKISQ